MAGAECALVGAIVQKNSRTARPSPAGEQDRIFGHVLGPAPAVAQNSYECLYHVIFEDGEEIFMPESDVCSWLISKNPPLGCKFPSRSPVLAATPLPSMGGPQVVGKIVGREHRPARGEPVYRVVYEDGDEACMPESEAILWATASAGDPYIARAAANCHPPYKSTTMRMNGVSCSTTPPIATTTTTPCRPGASVSWLGRGIEYLTPGLRADERRKMSFSTTPPIKTAAPVRMESVVPDWRSSRHPLSRYSEGPMPSRHLDLQSSTSPVNVGPLPRRWDTTDLTAGPVRTCSLGHRLAKYAAVLLLAVFLVNSCGKSVESIGRAAGSLLSFDNFVSTEARVAEDDLACNGMGAAWCQARIDRAY